MDNIFMLNTLVQNHIRLPRRKVFAVFVNFEKAFDSLWHNLLFEHLAKIKISSRVLKIIMNLYSNARTKLSLKYELPAEFGILKRAFTRQNFVTRII